MSDSFVFPLVSVIAHGQRRSDGRMCLRLQVMAYLCHSIAARGVLNGAPGRLGDAPFGHRPQKWKALLGTIRMPKLLAGASCGRKTGSTFPHDALKAQSLRCAPA